MGDLTISVTMTGGEGFLRADAAEIVRRIGNALALQAAQAVIDAATPNVPVDTGYLKSSGSASPTSDGAIAQYDAPYASAVEYGTPPHTPPLDALEGWAQRHGIPAFLVQRAIKERGTRAQPYFNPAVAVVNDQLPALAADAATELRAALLGGSS